MANNTIHISDLQLLLAAALMGFNILLSLALRLKLGKKLLVASVRMSGQLLLLGYLLEWIFSLKHPGFILLMTLFMTTLASVSAVNRTKRRFVGIYWHSFLSTLFSSFLVTGLALKGIIQVTPWFDPQYLIPILGMILGNTLSGISLALDRFMENLVQRQSEVETLFCLGANRWEAAHTCIQDAIRTGMIPILNTMLVMGIVSLPGMMTGQILAGAPPIEAVRYQILIVFMIASGIALGTFGVVLLAFYSLFSKEHRLQLHLLQKINN